MNLIKLYINTFSGLNRDVWILALIYLINRSGEMVIPFMSVFLTVQLGFTKLQSGIVLFSFGAGALIGSNIGGRLTDAIGNVKVMALSLFGSGIGFIGILFFDEFIPLCLWMLLTAVFSSMLSPAAFSAVGLWGKPGNQTRGYSLLRMAINLGIAIGPAIGGFIAYRFGFKWLFIIDGITCFIALRAVIVLLKHRNKKVEKSEDNKANMDSPYKDWAVMLFLFFNLINMVAFFQILFSVPVYFKEIIGLDERIIGLFFTANGLLVLILEMPLVFIIEKRNKYFGPMISGAIIIGIAFLCLSIFENGYIAIILYSLLIAFGEVINFPLIPTLVMRRAGPENQGKYMGLVSMMFAMAFLVAPLMGLPIIEHIGYNNYFYFAASLSVFSGICLHFIKSRFTEA
jgi:predicted MFS family arabinose efflux permease